MWLFPRPASGPGPALRSNDADAVYDSNNAECQRSSAASSQRVDELTSTSAFCRCHILKKHLNVCFFPQLSQRRCCSIHHVQTISDNVFTQSTCFKGVQVT